MSLNGAAVVDTVLLYNKIFCSILVYQNDLVDLRNRVDLNCVIYVLCCNAFASVHCCLVVT